jgi:mannose-6-phosphate isomerase-like protein (cupin superfamily)
MVEQIVSDGLLLAIIVRKDFSADGVKFFTPNDFSQQLAYMKHPTGKVIEPHVHNAVAREVHFTKEVLVIQQGKLRVDFYAPDKSYIESRILEGGDVILLSEGGHGFEVLEDLVMLEIKQGPYAGDQDKTRFQGVAKNNLHVKA